MTKKLISLLTAAMLVISMAAVAVASVSAAVDSEGCYYPSEEVQQDVGTNRYYFYMPSAWTSEEIKDETDHAGIYWWEGTDACGAVDGSNPDSPAWPGYLAQKGDIEGVFYLDCPIDVTTIIWNNHFNGGEDSSDPMFKLAAQTVNIGSEYYDPGESDLYPDGTDSFDNMIYVCDPTRTSTNELSGQKTYGGDWYYYYGNGQYGTYATLEEAEAAGEVFTGDTHVIDPNASTEDEPENPSTEDEPTTTEPTTTPDSGDDDPETQETTVGQPSTDPTSSVGSGSTADTPANNGGTSGTGSGAVQTGSASFAGVLLVLLASASGACFFVRKKLG